MMRLTPPARHRVALSRRSALALVAAVATAAVSLSGCGTNEPTTKAGGASTADTVSLLDGTTLAVPAKEPAALFFFSVGCGECVGGAKSLDEAAREFDGKATFLAVDMDPSESEATIEQFLDYIKAPELATTVDTNAQLARRYQVAALSTLIVVDPAGEVTYRATDPSSRQIQDALIEAGAE